MNLERDTLSDRVKEARALVKAQMEIRAQPRKETGEGNYGSYLELQEVQDLVFPIMNKHGFFLFQGTEPRGTEGKTYLYTRALYQETGNTLELSSIPLGLAGQSKTIQGLGSEETYLERRQLCKVFGIRGAKDDDGQRATDEASKKGAENKPVRENEGFDIDPKMTIDQVKLIKAAMVGKKELKENVLGYYKVLTEADLPAKAFNPIMKRIQEIEGVA